MRSSRNIRQTRWPHVLTCLARCGKGKSRSFSGAGDVKELHIAVASARRTIGSVTNQCVLTQQRVLLTRKMSNARVSWIEYLKDLTINKRVHILRYDPT
mmetsp:Transcript_23169/g.33224  ORF Transcript_23169/g.33224 Transcript_23169/m.33224 type:complete len:99 (-) Transcript_23169:195-491(-)